MKRILCATDLGPESESAVKVATALARALRARLELLYVTDLPPEAPDDLLASPLVPGFPAGVKKKLADRALAIMATGDLDVVTTMHGGFARDAIVSHAAETKASLLVLGTHRRPGGGLRFVGSVAEAAIRRVTCPVLVVPGGTEPTLATWTTSARRLRISAGVDASQASDAMLTWLRDFGLQLPCEFRFVHLYWPPRVHARLGMEAPDPFEPDREVASALARDLRPRIAAHLGIPDPAIRIRPVWGAEENALSWEASSDDADFLLVGTGQGRHGSTAVATVRGATVPVLCVPAHWAQGAAAEVAVPTPFRDVMVTTDFSPLGNRAVSEAYRLLMRGGGTVTLLHVTDPKAAPLTDELRNEIETRLLGLVPEGLAGHEIHARALVVEDSAPGSAIVKAVRRFGADVVVMASHGRSGVGRVVRGSVTEKVARHAPVPVLIVPSDEATRDLD